MPSSKFKKGDLVIVDDKGRPAEFEIVSSFSHSRGLKAGDEILYDVKDVLSGKSRTISEDEILRLATPVDNSSDLFPTRKD